MFAGHARSYQYITRLRLANRMFDEIAVLPQCSTFMRLASLILALSAFASCALAQNGTNNLRPVTLQESIKLAVENNLDLQVERINPQISLYRLNAAYGDYDPTFGTRASRLHNESGSSLFAPGFELPGTVSDADNINSSLSGLTPWGMTYNLSGNATDQYGTSGDRNNPLVTLPFESTTARVLAEIRQPLLKNFFIDSTRLNIRVSKNRLKYSEQQLRQRLMQIVTQTEQNYYSLIASREYVKVQQKAVELASRLLEENRKRVEVGAMAPLDEKQAEAQASSSRADLLEAQNLLAISEHALKNLVTDKYSEWADTELVASEPLEAPRRILNRQDSWSRGLTMRPDLIQSKLDVERAGLQLKFAKNQLLPQVDVFGTVGYIGNANENSALQTGGEFSDAFGNLTTRENPFYSYGGQLTVPLLNTGARNDYRASKAQERQAVLLVKRLEQQVLVEIDDAIRQAQSSFERVAARRAARQYAEAALEAEQKKLESGKSTSFQVLRLQRDLTQAASDELRALTEYNRSLATLSLSEGTTLARHNIDVQVK